MQASMIGISHDGNSDSVFADMTFIVNKTDFFVRTFMFRVKNFCQS